MLSSITSNYSRTTHSKYCFVFFLLLFSNRAKFYHQLFSHRFIQFLSSCFSIWFFQFVLSSYHFNYSCTVHLNDCFVFPFCYFPILLSSVAKLFSHWFTKFPSLYFSIRFFQFVLSSITLTILAHNFLCSLLLLFLILLVIFTCFCCDCWTPTDRSRCLNYSIRFDLLLLFILSLYLCSTS